MFFFNGCTKILPFALVESDITSDVIDSLVELSGMRTRQIDAARRNSYPHSPPIAEKLKQSHYARERRRRRI